MKSRPGSKILCIDASRCRSGGAVNHVINLIRYGDDSVSSFSEVHIWSYKRLLQRIPEKPWLIKHQSRWLESPLPFQLFWQAFILPMLLYVHKCSLLFSLDSSTLCRYKNHLVLNQDLLSFEKSIYKKMSFGYEKLRIIILRYVQLGVFDRSTAVIFLSNYSKSRIIGQCRTRINSVVISHGVDEDFDFGKKLDLDLSRKKEVNFIYISPIFEYKNHMTVINAIDSLRFLGYNYNLSLVGGGEGEYFNDLMRVVKALNSDKAWIKIFEFVSRSELLEHLKFHDIFIFASSCETFGITLLEGMLAGMPIVCSNQSSLPEILQDGGLYFDPHNVNELSIRLLEIVEDNDLRFKLAYQAHINATEFSWKKCSNETFKYASSLI